MIDGLIFDMDGVLLDTEKIYFLCWKQSAEEFGFSLPDEVALSLRSCCPRYAAPHLQRILGASFDYFAVRARRRELVSAYIAANGIETKPGILETLHYCEKENIVTVVATATARALALERLEMVGLSEKFSFVVGGDDVATGKPAPDIYRKAVATIGKRAGECVAAEDSPNGIVAAFAAGCHVVMVPDLTPPQLFYQPLLCGIVQSLVDLPQWLENARNVGTISQRKDV